MKMFAYFCGAQTELKNVLCNVKYDATEVLAKHGRLECTNWMRGLTLALQVLLIVSYSVETVSKKFKTYIFFFI